MPVRAATADRRARCTSSAPAAVPMMRSSCRLRCRSLTHRGQLIVMRDGRRGAAPITDFRPNDGLNTLKFKCTSCPRHFKIREDKFARIALELAVHQGSPAWSWTVVPMSPPRNKRSGPRAAKPEDRHQNVATATAKRQVAPEVMVRQGRRSHRYLLASASLHEPACQRTWWWISLRCPWCGGSPAPCPPRAGRRRGAAHRLRAPGVREGPHGIPRQGPREDSRVSPDWALMRLILSVLADDDGLADAELAEQLGVPVADVRQAARILYRQRRIDMCAGYMVAVSSSAEGRRAA